MIIRIFRIQNSGSRIIKFYCKSLSGGLQMNGANERTTEHEEHETENAWENCALWCSGWESWRNKAETDADKALDFHNLTRKAGGKAEESVAEPWQTSQAFHPGSWHWWLPVQPDQSNPSYLFSPWTTAPPTKPPHCVPTHAISIGLAEDDGTQSHGKHT